MELQSVKIDGARSDDEGYLYLTVNGVDMVGPLGPFAGSNGGGGSQNNAIMTMANTSGWLTKTISENDECYLSFNWMSVENEMPTGDGAMVVSVNGTTKVNRNIVQGDIAIDVKDHLNAGANLIRVTVKDAYGNTRSLVFNVSVVQFTLSSTFNDGIVYSDAIVFPYTATGNAKKLMQFELDGVLIASNEITSSRQQNFVIPRQEHGSYPFEVFFKATVNGVDVFSNHLRYDIIFVDEENNTPIISTNPPTNSVKQYYSVAIPYIVYTPNALTSRVDLYVNGERVQAGLEVGRTRQTWVYRADTVGENVLKICSGGQEKIITLNVSESEIDVHAEENNMELYLSSRGRSNGESDGQRDSWSYTGTRRGEEYTISAEFENFDWVTTGWVLDDEKNVAMRVSGDAKIKIPYNVFAEDFRSTGATIEFDFVMREVLDYEDVVISCMDSKNQYGFKFTSQKAMFISSMASIEAQYKDDEHVRISFVIGDNSGERTCLIYCYINGLLSGVTTYNNSAGSFFLNTDGITIGSKYSTIDLYTIRIYRNNLTRYQILDNYIADITDGYRMLTTFQHNNIYDDYNQIVIDKIPKDLPYLVIEAATLPQSKGDKKTVSGYYVDPSDPTKSFDYTGASIDVQGTSSQGYPRKNYKIKFSNGFRMRATDKVEKKYALRDGSIPVSTFTFKADVASSEGANNVELVRLYNDICPFETPPQKQSKQDAENNSGTPIVRQGIDGFPIVVFWAHDGSIEFIGKYNFNNDKGTQEVFGFVDGDECWETKDNTLDLTQFLSLDFDSEYIDSVTGTAHKRWELAYEGRFPDPNDDLTRLKALSEWIYSTNTETATGEALEAVEVFDGQTFENDTPAYRLAKFKAQVRDWFEFDDLIFYYVFTEAFLMVDSRVKNSFPTLFAGENQKWCWMPYDMDTALGINNEGLIVFDYYLEEDDPSPIGGAVYNGNDSVLWKNVRACFKEEIRTMYRTIRSNDEFNFEKIEERFEEHQSKWPIAVFNEDAFYKYIQPYVEKGESIYLSMCQGSKEQQRKWWLANRLKYLDSKYTTGDSVTNVITFRAYSSSDITIVPYAHVYIRVKSGSVDEVIRGEKNRAFTIRLNRDGSNDTESYIYSADQLRDIGDLSDFNIGFFDATYAVRLERLVIGGHRADEGLMNESFNSVSFDENRLMRLIDIRNCPNLKQSIDVKKCVNLEEFYAEGSSIISASFVDGGRLRKLHLPGTVTSLVLCNKLALEEFQMESFENVTTLRLENNSSVIDPMEIFDQIQTGSRVRIIGFERVFNKPSDVDSFIGRLSKMRGLDENMGDVDTAQMHGTIRCDAIDIDTLNKIKQDYPGITVDAKTVTSASLQYMLQTGEGRLVLDSVEALEVPMYTGGNKYTIVDFGPQFKKINMQKTSLRYPQTKEFIGFILRSETMVELTFRSPFQYNDRIKNGLAHCYVPRALIDQYRASSLWAYNDGYYRADTFRAIEDYPEICDRG